MVIWHGSKRIRSQGDFRVGQLIIGDTLGPHWEKSLGLNQERDEIIGEATIMRWLLSLATAATTRYSPSALTRLAVSGHIVKTFFVSVLVLISNNFCDLRD
jgi:hypothetical protein